MNFYSLSLSSGSGHRATIADASQTGLDLSTALTFEAWLNPASLVPTGVNSDQTILAKWVDSGNQRSYALQLFSSSGARYIRFLLSDNGSNISTDTFLAFNSLVVGTWSHIAATFNGTQAEYFLNGASIGTKSGGYASVYNSSSVFEVGSINGGSVYYDGLIDDLRIWNDVRTESEILANYRKSLIGNESNLVAYWRFENNYLDMTSNNNDLTGVNTPTFITTNKAPIDRTIVNAFML